MIIAYMYVKNYPAYYTSVMQFTFFKAIVSNIPDVHGMAASLTSISFVDKIQPNTSEDGDE